MEVSQEFGFAEEHVEQSVHVDGQDGVNNLAALVRGGAFCGGHKSRWEHGSFVNRFIRIFKAFLNLRNIVRFRVRRVGHICGHGLFGVFVIFAQLAFGLQFGFRRRTP